MSQGRLRAGAKVLLIESCAAILAWISVAPLSQPLLWGGVAGLAGLLLATLFGIKGWARWGCFAFWPLVGLALSLGLPAWIYLVGLLITLGLGRNALTERVPLYRSSTAVCAALAQRLPTGVRMLEAGCGDARLALMLAKQRPDLHIEAIENAWLTWCWAKLRWWMQGHASNVNVLFGNFWQLDWGSYDAIYVFLSPEPMPRLWRRFQKEGAIDGLLLSNSFSIPGVEPDETVPLGGPLQQNLLIWRRPHGAC
jgi:hypothetical protein